MFSIHFKLAYNGKTYRFAPTLQGDQLFQAVKDHVATIVKEEDYKLCWDDGESTMLLDTEDDFSDMLEYAKEEAKSSTKPPCIRLTVGVNDVAASEVAAAAAELQLDAAPAAVEEKEEKEVKEDEEEEQEEEEEKGEEDDDDEEEEEEEGDEDAVEATSDEDEDEEASTDASEPVETSETPTTEKYSDSFTKLGDLLDSTDEKHRKEMDELRTLTEDLKNHADKRMTVESFALRPSMHALEGGDVQFDMTFKSRPDYSMWKKCIEAALFKLDLSESALRSNSRHHFLRGDEERWHMTVALDTKDLKRVFELLKPLASQTNFISVRVDEEQPKQIRLLSEFLHGASVKAVTFNTTSLGLLGKSKKKKAVDYGLSLNLLQKLKPSELNYYRTQAKQEMFDFLEKSADLVEQMRVYSMCYGKKKEEPIPLTLAQNILSRKCNYLSIIDSTTNLTLSEAEELVKFFEEKEMKVSLAVATKEKMKETKIGAYSVKICNSNNFARGNRQISIEHEEMDPKMDEMDQESAY